jgi:hypothetical protein
MKIGKENIVADHTAINAMQDSSSQASFSLAKSMDVIELVTKGIKFGHLAHGLSQTEYLMEDIGLLDV